MTQTNNERELFETDDGKWDGVIRAFWRRIQGYQKCEFNDIKDLPDPLPVEFRAHFATALLNAPKELRTPISQNEPQPKQIPDDVIKDAARYNWLKQNYHGFEMFRHSTIPYVTLDREVDKAMLNTAPNKSLTSETNTEVRE